MLFIKSSFIFYQIRKVYHTYLSERNCITYLHSSVVVFKNLNHQNNYVGRSNWLLKC